MRRPSRSLRTTAALALLAAGMCLAPAGVAATAEPLASLRAAFQRAAIPGEDARHHGELLTEVMERVRRHHVQAIDLDAFAGEAAKVLDAVPPGTGVPADLFRTSVNAALRAVDRYARYTDEQTRRRDTSESEDGFGGLGLQLQASGNALLVVAPMPDTPAARAGVLAGDRIVQVDARPMDGVPLAEAVALLRGAPGTPVSLTIRRPGVDDAIQLSLLRDTIRRPLLRARREGDALVLRLSSFSGPVSAALRQAVAEHAATGLPRGVVLDLRGNLGGLLREGIQTAGAFLASGVIASMHGRSAAHERTWSAGGTALLEGVPMVVLIDGDTASASELVADALRQHGRARLMGQRSYGKGSVQTTYALGENDGALKITTALYHGPSGRSVNGVGLTPDIALGTGGTDPQRCLALQLSADAGTACALAWLRAGGDDGFATLMADQVP